MRCQNSTLILFLGISFKAIIVLKNLNVLLYPSALEIIVRKPSEWGFFPRELVSIFIKGETCVKEDSFRYKVKVIDDL